MRISRRSLFGIGLAPWCWSCATRGLHWHDNSLYENTRISFTRSVEDARHQVRSVDLYTMRIDGDEERKIAEGFVRQPTWSPNGRNIAYVDAENVLTQQRMPSRLKLVSVESQKTTSLGVCDARAKLAFSPDGTWLACTLFMARPGEVIGENWGTAIVNVHTSEIRKFKFESGGLPLWTPDGQRLLLHDCGSYVIDLRTNEGRKVLDHCTETTQWIDDTRFLVADGRKIGIYSTAGELQKQLVTLPDPSAFQKNELWRVHISPDKSRAAYWHFKSDAVSSIVELSLKCVDLVSGSNVALVAVDVKEMGEIRAVWSPDSSYLFYQAFGRTWWWFETSGRSVRTGGIVRYNGTKIIEFNIDGYQQFCDPGWVAFSRS